MCGAPLTATGYSLLGWTPAKKGEPEGSTRGFNVIDSETIVCHNRDWLSQSQQY